MNGSLGASRRNDWKRNLAGAVLASMCMGIGAVHAQCDPLQVPYSQDFSGLVGGALPLCFETQNLTGSTADASGNWRSASVGGGNFQMPVAQVVTVDPQDYDAWMFLPRIQLNAGTSYRLSYRYGTNSGSSGSNNQGNMSVWYGADQDWLSMNTLLVDHGTFSGLVFEQTIDFVPSSSGAFSIGFQVYSEPETWMVLLDDISLTLTPSCLEPTNIVAAGTTPFSGEVSWDCPGCTGEYVVEYGPAAVFTTPGVDDSPGPNGTIASMNATSPFTLQDLVSGEQYRVFVRQRCGNEHSPMLPGAQFTTTLFNGFCGFPAFMECNTTLGGATWEANSSNDLSIYCGDFQPFGTQGVWYRVFGNGGELQLSTCAVDGGSALEPVRMVLYTGVCNALQCVDIATPGETCEGTRLQWESVPGEEYLVYVTSMSFGGTSFTLALSCDEAPTCPAPESLAVVGVTPNSVNMTWANVPIAEDYTYELRTSGLPGSGLVGLVASADNVLAGPVPIAGLEAQTTYTFYVRSNCAGGNDISIWRGLNVTTACLPVDVPYDGGFTTEAIPPCMSVMDMNGGETWMAVPRPSPQYTAPFVARYGGSAGQPQADDWLFTGAINTQAGMQYRLRYRYSVLSSLYPERLVVHIGNAPVPGAMGAPVATHDPITANNNAPVLQNYLVTPGEGPIYIGFHANSTSQGWQLFLGDIHFDLEPLCFPPAAANINVTSTTTASATWVPEAGAVGHFYELRTSGEPGSGPLGLVASGTEAGNTLSFNGLAPGTVHQLYIMTDCGGSGTSAWSAATVFTTYCLPATVPYSEDFSGLVQGALPLCHVARNLTGTPDAMSGNWRSASLSGFHYDMPVAQVVTVDPQVYDAWLFMQGLELHAGVSYRLSYRYGTNSGSMGANNQGHMAVWLGNEPLHTAMDQLLIDHGQFSGPVFSQFIDFTPATDGVHYIGFRVYSQPSTWMVVLDDILVDESPSCLEPIIGAVEVNGPTEAVVSWTCTGCTGQYIVEYGPAALFTEPGISTEPGAFGTIASMNAVSPFTLEGLVSGEEYRVFVRQVCGGDDYGAPYLPAVFSTPLVNGFCATATWMECGQTYPGATAMAPPLALNGTFCGFAPAGNQGVWYAVIGSGDTYRVSTCTEDGGWQIADTRILVLGGQNCTGFSCAGFSVSGEECDGARVEWLSVQGTVYYVFVTGAPFETTSFDLAFSCGSGSPCADPVGLQLVDRTSSAVTFNWVNAPLPTYSYELRSSGAPGSGPLGLEASASGLTSGPVTVADLDDDTPYVAYLRAHCDNDGISEWVALPFRTLCLATVVPYDGGFTEAAIPDCFTVLDANADDRTWMAIPAPIAGYNSPFVARYGPDVAGGPMANDWLFTQSFIAEPGVSYRVRYRYSVISALYPERLRVHVGSTPQPGSMTVIAEHPSITNSNQVVTQEVLFTPGGGEFHVAFECYSLGSGWQLYLGDIFIDIDSDCGAPPALALALDDDNVLVEWSCEGCTGAFLVEHGAAGFVPGTGSEAGEGTLAGPFTGTNAMITLTGASALEYHVRRECAPGVFSDNTGPLLPLAAQLVDCDDPQPFTYCYGNNEDVLFRFKAAEGQALAMMFAQGQMQACCDNIAIHDGPGTGSPMLYEGNGGGQLAGITAGSTNPWGMITLRIVSDFGNSCQDNALQPMVLDLACGAVGVREVVASDMVLHPNPAQDAIHLTWKGASVNSTVQLLDLSGRVLHAGTQWFADGATVRMDISRFSAGSYLFHAETPAGRIVKQFQVVR